MSICAQVEKARLCRSFLVAFVSVLVCATVASADNNIPRESLPLSWQADADLTDVFFLNRDVGWAIGGQGVILRTTNGGKDWIESSQVNQSTMPELALDQKIRAMRSGVQTNWTGIANGSANQFQPYRCRFESIHFVDELHGWIAGGYDVPYVDRSRGVILKTSDGGVSWRPVEGLVIPRINRIRFSDRANGWAIGKMGNLFRTGIYYTSDGGETWSSQSSGEMKDWIDGEQTENGFVNIDSSGQLGVIKNNRHEVSVLLEGGQSRMSRLQMIDKSYGWAVGSEGAILQTTNGGLSWSPVVRMSGCQPDQNSAQPENSDFPVSGGMFESHLDQPVRRSSNIRDAAGDRNICSSDFDFNSLSITPGKIWIAGNPGSQVFSIDRQTGAVEALKTGVPLPILDIHFVDDQTGWAVGMLGTIMATVDGGQSWHLQRGQHRSIAMLGVASAETDLPLELFASFAGEENRICVGAVFTANLSNAALQASERLGCSTLLGLAHRASQDMISDEVDAFNRNERMRKMVRTLRTMRPNVVVSNSQPADSFDRSRQTRQLDLEAFLLEAIRASADRSVFPEQLSEVGLQTWQVDRLAVRDVHGALSINSQRMLPRTGSLVEDRIAISRALLSLPLATKETANYRIQHFSVGSRGNESDLFAGLAQHGQAVPTRNADVGFRGNLHAIQLANSKQKKLDEFADFDFNGPQDFRVWYQQILSWTLSLDENVAGIWLAQLAERYLAMGHTELAANTLEILATRMSNHAFAPAALTWLVQYYASDELAQIAFRQQLDRQQSQHQLATTSNGGIQVGDVRIGNLQSQMAEVQAGGVSQLVWTPKQTPVRRPQSNSSSDNEIALMGYLESEDPSETIKPGQLPINNPEGEAFFLARWQRASQLMAGLGQRDPDLVSGQSYRVLESQINRKLNGTLSSEAILKKLMQTLPDPSGVAIGASRELALAGLLPDSQASESVACAATTERPRLDGSLQDPVWQNQINQGPVKSLRRYQTHGDQAGNPDLAMFAFDEQFFYVAFRCVKLPGQFYQPSSQPRPRDADLTRRDRVAFSLDVDRDYNWANEFVVDYRGWVSERCGGATGWNPEWFVSCSEDAVSWTVELAIPLEQLVSTQIKPESVWGIRLARRTHDETNLWDSSPIAEHTDLQRDDDLDQQGPSSFLGMASQPTEYELLEFK